MGVVIEICIKHPGGPTRMTVAGMHMVPVFIRSTGILRAIQNFIVNEVG
jgi:hypothetical protein